MSDNSKIEWTDATWNPVIGCTKVSPGCDNCYAIRTAHRMSANPNPVIAAAYGGTEADMEWTGQVNLLRDRLDQPIRWRRPRRIFVNSQSDLFHNNVPDEFIARVFAVMSQSPQHTFQVLTKRHGRMRSLLSSDGWPHMVAREAFAFDRRLGEHAFQIPLPNVWLGVSVENQQWANIRIPALLATPAALRFLSCEPLLGPVDIRQHLDPERDCSCNVPAMEGAGQHAASCGCLSQTEIDWVIAGGESGPGARPMHPNWARNLRDQCELAGVSFHFKQWGEWAPHKLDGGVHTNSKMSKHRNQYESTRFAPDGTVYVASDPDLYSYPAMASMLRVGKNKAGRELDGRTWDGYPEPVTV